MSYFSDFLPMQDAVQTLSANSRPSPSTLYRWRKYGIKGIRLETVMIGGRRYVSRAALRSFVERMTAAVDGQIRNGGQVLPKENSFER